LKVIKAIPTHPRARAKRRLKPKPPQPRRLPPLTRSKRRLQRKRPVRKPRRSKRRKKALTLATKAKANKAEARTLKTARRIHPQTLVQMMNKRKENPPRNDHERTERLFLNS
jgi:hypothetical protein